ncbi:MAG: aminodeoxychorismate synthase component I [Methylotenera sp.]
MTMLKHELAYHHDSARLFERIAHQPWAILLDSGQMLNPATGKAGSQYGRYDIMVAEPFVTLVTRDKQTTITQNGAVIISEEDPFFLLKSILNQYQVPKTDMPFAGGTLPFAGGALGYFAYDLARRLEKLPNNARPAINIPEMMIGIYDWAIVVDHREQRSILVSHGLNAETHSKWHNLCTRFGAPFRASSAEDQLNHFQVTTAITSNLSEPQYQQAFAKIKAYITAGDCYQVNLAQRFSAKVEGDSWLMYRKLREISPAPFMAYMQLPLNEDENFQVLSDSPERFIQVTGKHVETRPIKGTRPRSADAKQDLAYSKELLTSVKDRAENLMIVDLLRNDLGKTCVIGSVKVNKLFQLQSFANVHHLVSIIVGKLKPDKTAVDVLRDCFPGGSITGAPKLRAMQIIDELEPHRRGLYCGAIGYTGFDGDMDTNIAIRTAVICKNRLNFYAGGGIVADSDGSKEYAETLDKASSFTTITKFFTRL